MAIIDEKYKRLVTHILDNGYDYADPNRVKQGVVRKEIQSCQIEHKFKDGFPLLTTKKMFYRGIFGELLWILRGDTNIKYLVDNSINIWNKDAHNWYKQQFNICHPQSSQNIFTHEEFVERIKEGGDLNNFQNVGITLGDVGRNYGAQLRNWEGKFDQLKWLIEEMKTNPMKTKKTVTFWNPAESYETALTPCHWSFEILVRPRTIGEKMIESRKKDNFDQPQHSFILKWHQHSVDTFLGLPFNIAFYAALAHIIGYWTNMIPEGIIGDLSNVHVYYSHIPAIKEQMERGTSKYGPCSIEIPKIEGDIDTYLKKASIEDFKINNYKSYPAIPAEMLAYDN